MIHLIANWKSHKKLAEVRSWFDQLDISQINPQSLNVIICPPAPFILDVYDLIHTRRLPFHLGIQDMSPYPFGAYTGAIAAAMVADWVEYAIIGHSERRQYFAETDQQITNKATEEIAASMTPIICVDEPYLKTQLKSISRTHATKIMVAYEPLAAIGSGTADTPEHADTVAQTIKELTDNRTPVLYGGSVTSENIGYFLNQTHINGALIGNASLDPTSFSKLIAASST